MKKAGQIAGKIIVWILGGVVAVFCAIRLFYIFAGTATGLAAAAYVIVRAILKLWPYLLAAAAIAGAVLAVRGYIRKRKDETAQKLEATYKEGFQSGVRVGKAAGQEEGVAQGRKEALVQGREEGYSLGHSEGYKYALYTQNRFRYYNDDPPLTYEEARRSLDEGTDGANGELIEQEPNVPQYVPAESGDEDYDYREYEYEDEDYDEEGYNRHGYDCHGYDRYGYDREGYDHAGFNRKGFNRDGFNREGYDCAGFDRKGFNRAGFDRHGRDSSGYDINGFDRYGRDRKGRTSDDDIFGPDGYDKDGFDKYGFDKYGCDRGGHDREDDDHDSYNSDGDDSVCYDSQGRCRFSEYISDEEYERNEYLQDRMDYDRDWYNYCQDDDSGDDELELPY